MMNKIAVKKVIYFALILLSGSVFAQSNLGFYQMGNALPQGGNYNPAFFPDARVYVSLPAISGIDFSMNNSFGISDVFTETGDSTLVDINKFLDSQEEGDSFFSTDLRITNLMVGFRVGSKNHFSLFVNERIDATIFYPIDLMNFLWQGNASFIGQNFVADDASFSATAFREWGIGYGRQFDILGRETTIGVRLKYLNGMFHASTENLGVSILTDETDYSLSATFNDAQIRTAGFTQFDDEGDFSETYFINNDNGGFGVDLGARMQFSDKLGLGVAVNDLGFINWQDDAELISFTGTSFEYAGIDLDDTESFGEAIADSLENIDTESAEGTFRTNLNARTYFSADYQLVKGGFAQATLANFISQGKIKTSFGLGYNQNVGRWFMASAITSYVPQRGIDLGLGLMFRLSSFQLYVAADNLTNTLNVPEANSANFKVGLNFLFGREQKRDVKKVKSTPLPDTEDLTISVSEEEDEYDDYSHLWK